VDVNILGIVGSPRKGGNTEVMMRAALEAAESLGGVRTEIILMAGRKVSPCTGCHHCWFHDGVCAFKDDAGDMIQKMLEADGMVVGSPVYFGSLSATLKGLLERCLKLNRMKRESDTFDTMAYQAVKSEEVIFPLRNKVGGALSVGGVQSGGQERVIIDIHGFFLLNDMIVVTDGGMRTPEVHPHFGGVGIGRGKKQVENNPYGMATSRSVGLRVAEVAKLIKLGMSLSQEGKAGS
jgi:multimeric flavodoxin WrbA